MTLLVRYYPFRVAAQSKQNYDIKMVERNRLLLKGLLLTQPLLSLLFQPNHSLLSLVNLLLAGQLPEDCDIILYVVVCFTITFASLLYHHHHCTSLLGAQQRRVDGRCTASAPASMTDHQGLD